MNIEDKDDSKKPIVQVWGYLPCMVQLTGSLKIGAFFAHLMEWEKRGGCRTIGGMKKELAVGTKELVVMFKGLAKQGLIDYSLDRKGNLIRLVINHSAIRGQMLNKG